MFIDDRTCDHEGFAGYVFVGEAQANLSFEAIAAI
jgi:hypothetical protein